MRDLLDQISEWLENGHSIALASVINTWGSSPRPVGAGMAVTQDGQIAGSVSGGCVEGAVIQAALEVIELKSPVRLHFGVADTDAWEVGLACGGEIEIFIRPFSSLDLKKWMVAFEAKRSFCSVMLIDSDENNIGQEFFLFEDMLDPVSDLNSDLRKNLATSAREILLTGKSATRIHPHNNQVEIFVTVLTPPVELILVGGVHIAIPLGSFADLMGFNVTVIDPRGLFSTNKRFPDVNLLSEWPSSAFKKIRLSSSSAVVMLTHDPKIDDPAIITALGSPAFYIGALGSKKTHQKRLKRLLGEGVPEDKLNRIHAPIGLDLRGRSPEEIALAVISQIVLEWNKISV
ncbi:MAG: XdhC family protein [Anaerolineales bacterium]